MLTSIFQYAAFLLTVLLLVKPVGAYLAEVFESQRSLLDPLLNPLERLIYRLLRVAPETEMGWKTYCTAFILFSMAGTVLVYALLRLQQHLPGGPADAYLTTPITPDLAFNTAISFSTTTTWQAYAGESTMRYWTQMLAFVAQNFMAGAAGLAVGIAFIRGLARRDTELLGNFWVDVVRATTRVLLPLSIVGGLLLVWLGVPMNFKQYATVQTLEGGTQIIARGPVAALEFIEQLGTNGGGFFNANGAHPFQNPTPLSNWIEMLAIAVLPASLTYTFGKMTGKHSAGWALLAVMVVLFIAGLAICDRGERPTPAHFANLGLTGGNMEGKETRFGIGASVLTATTTSNGATGSTNAMPDSLSPTGVAVPLSNMLLGEITFGGLGTGLFSLIITAMVGLFMAGLMVGRTPEYLGKRLGPGEMKLVMLFNLATPLAVLLLTAVAVSSTAGVAGLTTNTGPHGFTEILFAYASCMANNGQSMGGLSSNSVFYNVTTTVAMIVGRFGLVIPALALAGKLAGQGRRVTTAGSLPDNSSLFVVVVLGAAVLIGGLNFLPSIALGPAVEYFTGLRSLKLY
jgi:K+-transporting ATPase ATPase A chain